MTIIDPLIQTDNGDVSYQKINSNEASLNANKAEVTGTITDDALIKGDGGTNGVQETGITVDDSNNVSGVADLSADSISVTDFGDISTTGRVDQTFTATEDDQDAIIQNIDADGNESVSALQTAYKTGSFGTGDTVALWNAPIDNTSSTGGTVAGIFFDDVGTGDATITAMVSGVGVSPLVNFSNSFGDIDEGLVNAVDETANLNNSGVDTSVFLTNSDTVTIGEAATFNNIRFTLTTGASFDGIQPTFEFSTGVGTWTTFSPSDGTNGFKNSGILNWVDAEVPGWAVGTGGNFLIRITRTEASLTTTPIAGQVQTSTSVFQGWDRDGVLTANEYNGSFIAPSINAPNYNSLNDAHKLFNSPGILSGGTVTDLGDGTVSAISAQIAIRANNSDTAEISFAKYITQTVTLTDNALNYICASYDTATTDPTVAASTTAPTDFNTNVLISTVYRAGTSLDITNELAFNVANGETKIIRRLQDVEPFARADNGGAEISETGTRNIATTAGQFYEGLNNFTTVAQDTSGTDSFKYYYQDGGGGWTVANETIGATVFTGAGLDDATSGGTYTGDGTTIYRVEIDTTGGTDTFKWYKRGVLQASGISLTGAAQTLIDGVTVTFGATTGHTSGDFWEITASLSTQIDNLQYDDGSGTLATLSNNQYGVHWVYIDVLGYLQVLYGRDSYSLGGAEDASIPSNTPPEFEKHNRIIGKIIIQKSDATFTLIESAFASAFTTSVPTEHNSLSGLQGGQAGEYYHLTSSEYTNNVTSPSSSVTDNSVPRFDGTTGKLLQDGGEAIVIQDDDAVSFGTTSNEFQFGGGTISAKHLIQTDGSDVSDFSLLKAAGSSAIFAFGRANGTPGSETTLANGENVATFFFAGHDGTAYQSVASLEGIVDGTVSSGIVPGRLDFNTTDSAGSLETRMQILSDGDVAIDTDTLYVDATNSRVGINDSTPTYDLDVKALGGASAITQINGSTGNNARLLFTQNDSIKWNTGLANTDLKYTIFDNVNSLTPFTVFPNSPNNSLKIDTTEVSIDNDLAVDTDTLYVDATDDKVGVNNDAPVYDLDVTTPTNTPTIRSIVSELTSFSTAQSILHGRRTGTGGAVSSMKFINRGADTSDFENIDHTYSIESYWQSAGKQTLRFYSDTTEVARFFNSGNLSLGTTTDVGPLGVAGHIALEETTAPGTSAGFGKIYVKSSDSKLYYQDDAGTETDLTDGGGGVDSDVINFSFTTTTTTNIAHSLGKAPTTILASGLTPSVTSEGSFGAWSDLTSTQESISLGSSASNGVLDGTYILNTVPGTDSTFIINSVTSTNINVTFTKGTRNMNGLLTLLG